jgi:glycosyltransferase involved in cell wall biosynthesis
VKPVVPEPDGDRRLGSLYLCYFPLTEPLVETQVLAYLRGLASSGHRIHLLTFETERRSRRERSAIRRQLASDGITWHGRRYHKRPSLPATAFDVLVGVVSGTWIVHRNRLDVVHARTHVPGVMGLAIRRLTGCGLVFDIRGLMAEEYVDAGTWRVGSLPYRLIKAVERRCLAASDGVVVLTERARRLLFGDSDVTERGAPVVVIPSCVDVEAVAGQRDARSTIRARLGFVDDEEVLVYAGKFSTWYLAREMAAFFAAFRAARPDARFLVLTQSDPSLITSELAAEGVPANEAIVTRVAPAEVGSYLAAADLAISFIMQSPSKIASSPTKIGEYLAAGLPIVNGAGVGDTDALMEGQCVGVVVSEHSPTSYAQAIADVLPLIGDAAAAERCRALAAASLSLRDVGIPRYRGLYAGIADRRR